MMGAMLISSLVIFPALTAMQSPWAAAVHRTNLTLTFPGGVKCRVRSVKCSELPFLLF